VTSVVAIINNALNIIGASNITDLGENSKTARVMNQMYESIRDDVFRAHPWNCLIRRATLAQSVTAPEFDYAYQYALPDRSLLPARPRVPEWVDDVPV
jgi:hypothetical protein